MVKAMRNGHDDTSSKTVCFLHNADTLGKDMNPIILSYDE